MRAFWIKTNNNLLLGNDECIFIFTTKEEAQHRLDTTDAEPQEVMRILEISVEEVQ